MTGLCLGTVQFGMDYGVQGGRKPSVDDAVRIMDFAVHNGVDALDTADDYGSAEDVVGEFLARRVVPRDTLYVVTKFNKKVFGDAATPADRAARLRERAERSLARLRTDYLDALICHDPFAAGDDEVTEALLALKASGLVRHVGVSVYDPDQAKATVATEGLDFLQGPFSVLDQRLAASGALAAAAARGFDVHTRSAFVQGLMLMDADRIPERLAATRPLVARLEAACAARGLTRRRLALAYVKSHAEISHLLFGVDSLEQLREIVADWNAPADADAVREIAAAFADTDTDLVQPMKWKKA